MADIIGGLNSLTTYLRSENEYQKKELEKEKQKISAQRIAQGFKSINSNNTENDARTLVYDLINDAASLDSLDTNIGLIDSLYKDTINSIKQAKVDRQDQALSSYFQDTKGFNAPKNLTGAQKLELYKLDVAEQTPFDQTNAQGQVIHRILNARNEVVGKPIFKNEQTDRQREELKFEFTRKNTMLSHSLSNQGLKGYAGITDSGLPLLLGPNGLLVQQGGKLVMYDESTHGTINKGSSYNTNEYKDYKGKVNFYQDVSKSGYLLSESMGQNLINMLNLQGPLADPITKKPRESNMGYLLRVGGGRQGLWNKIDARFPKSTPEHDKLYSDFQTMMSSYEANQSALKEVQIAEVENKYNLGLDNFRTLDEQMTPLLSIDTKDITSNISLDDAKRTNKVDEWVAYQIKKIIRSKSGKNFDSDQSIIDYYNKLSIDEKGQILQQARNK